MAGGFIDVQHNEAPMASGSVDARSFFDGSGWTVSTGRSSARGGDRTESTASAAGAIAGGAAPNNLVMYAAIAGVVIVAALLLLRKKG